VRDIWCVDGLAPDLSAALFVRRQPADFTNADWLDGDELQERLS
jgi:hypothetical protein